jgi:TP901 family phage tail tape measure protein
VAEAVYKILVDMQGMENAMRGLDDLTRRLGVTTAGLVALDTVAAQAALKYEYAVAKVATVSKDVGARTQAFEDAVQSLTTTLDHSSNKIEIAGAAYEIASSGFDKSADILKIVERSTKTATAGFTDVLTVADAVTTVLNSYAASTRQLGDVQTATNSVTNQAIVVQNLGKITVGQYAQQVGRLAAAASSAGIPLEELNAYIAAATRNGVPARQAFTALQATIAAIITPSQQAIRESARIGLAFDATTLKTRGLAYILNELAANTQKSAETQGLLFNSVEAFKGVSAVAGDNINQFNDFLRQMQVAASGAGQEVDKAYETMSGTRQVKAIQAMNAVSDALIEIGQGVAIIVEPVANAIKFLSDNFTALPEPIKQATGMFLLLSGGAATLGLALVVTVGYIVGVTNSLRKVWQWLGGAKISFKDLFDMLFARSSQFTQTATLMNDMSAKTTAALALEEQQVRLLKGAYDDLNNAKGGPAGPDDAKRIRPTPSIGDIHGPGIPTPGGPDQPPGGPGNYDPEPDPWAGSPDRVFITTPAVEVNPTGPVRPQPLLPPAEDFWQGAPTGPLQGPYQAPILNELRLLPAFVDKIDDLVAALEPPTLAVERSLSPASAADTRSGVLNAIPDSIFKGDDLGKQIAESAHFIAYMEGIGLLKAKIGDEVAGLMAYEIAEATGDLHVMFLGATQQGKGAGKALMQEAFKLATEMNTNLYLEPLESAVTFYREMGLAFETPDTMIIGPETMKDILSKGKVTLQPDKILENLGALEAAYSEAAEAFNVLPDSVQRAVNALHEIVATTNAHPAIAPRLEEAGNALAAAIDGFEIDMEEYLLRVEGMTEAFPALRDKFQTPALTPTSDRRRGPVALIEEANNVLPLLGPAAAEPLAQSALTLTEANEDYFEQVYSRKTEPQKALPPVTTATFDELNEAWKKLNETSSNQTYKEMIEDFQRLNAETTNWASSAREAGGDLAELTREVNAGQKAMKEAVLEGFTPASQSLFDLEVATNATTQATQAANPAFIQLRQLFGGLAPTAAMYTGQLTTMSAATTALVAQLGIQLAVMAAITAAMYGASKAVETWQARWDEEKNQKVLDNLDETQGLADDAARAIRKMQETGQTMPGPLYETLRAQLKASATEANGLNKFLKMLEDTQNGVGGKYDMIAQKAQLSFQQMKLLYEEASKEAKLRYDAAKSNIDLMEADKVAEKDLLAARVDAAREYERVIVDQKSKELELSLLSRDDRAAAEKEIQQARTEAAKAANAYITYINKNALDQVLTYETTVKAVLDKSAALWEREKATRVGQLSEVDLAVGDARVAEAAASARIASLTREDQAKQTYYKAEKARLEVGSAERKSLNEKRKQEVLTFEKEIAAIEGQLATSRYRTKEVIRDSELAMVQESLQAGIISETEAAQKTYEIRRNFNDRTLAGVSEQAAALRQIRDTAQAEERAAIESAVLSEEEKAERLLGVARKYADATLAKRQELAAAEKTYLKANLNEQLDVYQNHLAELESLHNNAQAFMNNVSQARDNRTTLMDGLESRIEKAKGNSQALRLIQEEFDKLGIKTNVFNNSEEAIKQRTLLIEQARLKIKERELQLQISQAAIETRLANLKSQGLIAESQAKLDSGTLTDQERSQEALKIRLEQSKIQAQTQSGAITTQGLANQLKLLGIDKAIAGVREGSLPDFKIPDFNKDAINAFQDLKAAQLLSGKQTQQLNDLAKERNALLQKIYENTKPTQAPRQTGR